MPDLTIIARIIYIFVAKLLSRHTNIPNPIDIGMSKPQEKLGAYTDGTSWTPV